LAHVALACAALFAVPCRAIAAEPGSPGVKAGDSAPAFTLKDAQGTDVSLASLTATGKVALVFFRSADWCPFCIAQLKELQANLPQFDAAGLKVVGISYDSVETLAKAAARHQLTFTLLSDAGSATIDAYGIRNLEAKGRASGVPHPAVFIVDETGVIQARLMHDGYKTRPTPAEIVAAAKAGR
jgi:peroxiredoxin